MSVESVGATSTAQAAEDARVAWALACELSDANDPRARDRGRGLVLELRADVARFDAAQAWARQRLATTPETRRARWVMSIALLEQARALVIEAGAHRSQRRRHRLIARLGGGAVKPYRQSLAHRHSWPRTALRRLDPRWWAARCRAWDRVTVEHHRPAGPGVGLHSVTLRRGLREIGSATCTVCAPCQVVRVDQIDVQPDDDRRGLGTGLLDRLRAELPGYRWCTTAQRATARTFWRRLQHKHPGEYFDGGDERGLPCPHITAES